MSFLAFIANFPSQTIICVSIVIFFIVSPFSFRKKISASLLFFIVLLLALVCELCIGRHSLQIEMLQVTPLTFYGNLLFLASGFLFYILSQTSDEIYTEDNWENFGLLLTSILGMMILTIATDLLLVVIALEMIAIPCYVLVTLNRKEPLSAEASLKYVLYGAFTTSLTLYGASLFFGLLHTMQIPTFWQHVSDINRYLFVFVLFLLLASVFFKISAMPFHFWTPDIYETAPLALVAFLSIAPKAAGLFFLARFFSFYSTFNFERIIWLLAFVGLANIVISSFIALKQTNIKRLLAYSSISHVGWILLAISLTPFLSVKVAYLYIILYSLMNFVVFCSLELLCKDRNYKISALSGKMYSSPAVATMLSFGLFSLIGLPLTAGFVAKFYILNLLLTSKLQWVIGLVLVSMLLSSFYYIRVFAVLIKETTQKETEKKINKRYIPVYSLLAVSFLLLLFVGFYWMPFVDALHI